jgi:hypothetical protein
MSTSAFTDIAATLAPFLVDTDTAAIHEATAGEIGDITAKAAPLIDDVFMLEDAAAAEAKKSTTLGAMLKAPGQVTNMAAATILVTDKIAFEDASDTLAMKEATVQELFAAPAWVTGLAAKAVPTVADKIPVEDAADSAAMKECTIQQIFAAAAAVDGLTSKATPIAADTMLVNDSAASGAAKKITIGSIPVAQAQVVGIVLQPAADAAVAILGTTASVQLVVTAAPTVAISDGAGVYAGQALDLFALAVAGGGSYTLALDVGTLTLNATGEGARVRRNAGNTAWVCVGLFGATIV